MKGKSPYIILAIGVILIVVAGLLYTMLIPEGQSLLMLIPWAKQAPSAAPKINLSALPSLGDLARAYPKLAPILMDAELGSVYKDFLIILQDEGQENALIKAQEWGLLTPDGKSLRVTLVLDTEDHEVLTAQLEAVGLTVVSAYANQVNVGVPIAVIIDQLGSENPGEIFQRLSELDHVIAVRLPQTKNIDSSTIDGEGIEVVGADVWHQAGYTGTGIRIGVLDLGFSGHEDLLGEELPDQVGFAQFGWYDEEQVHGAACAEIIHEMAPDASLFFAWYDGSDPSFGDAVEWLVDQGVDIISHSAGTPVSSRDGKNFDASVVDDVVADGILWVNSSGNDGEHHYRSVFYDPDADNLHEFENGEETLPVYNNSYVEVYLIWSDNWGSAAQDYDLAAYDLDGNLLEISRDTQDGSYGSYPTEGVKIQTGGDTIYVAVISSDATEDVTFDLFVRGSGVSIPYGTPQYSVGSPGDAKGSLTVGATSWRTDALEPYSSQGPTTDERLKPDISAPAGVSGATYGSYGFDGTSASTPHVAAAAALVWQAHPEFSRQQVIDFLLNASIDYGVAGADTGYGYGRLRLPSPTSLIDPSPTATTEAPSPTSTTEAPLPTPTNEELGSALVPVPTRTMEPTPTRVAFSTPEPEYPNAGDQVGRAALLGVLVLGPGCGGTVLVLLGILAMVRTRKPMPRGQVAPYSAPPHPTNAPPHPTNAPPHPTNAPPHPTNAPPHPTNAPQQVNVNYQPPPAPPSQPRPSQIPSQSPPRSGVQPLISSPRRLDNQHDSIQKSAQNVCPKCGSTQKENARFCRKCGAVLAPANESHLCPHCGSEIKSRSLFCPKCGKAI